MARDPLIGPLKSALQKEIRRGNVSSAAAIARELERRDVDSLARRLSVIAPEDVDWRLTPLVGKAAQAAMTSRDSWLDDPQPDLVSVAAAMAARPKDKEGWWLPATVWGDRYPTPADRGPSGLAKALEEGNHRKAFAIAHAAVEGRQFWGPSGVGQALKDEPMPAAAREIVEWSFWRARLGGLGVGECIAGAILAAIDKPEIPSRLELVEWEAQPPVLPWYAFDGHTRLGGVALGSFAKKRGIKRDMLASLMFHVESIRLGPVELGSRWKGEALQLVAQQEGWIDHEHGVRLWEEIVPDFRGLVEWLMRKDGLL